MNVKTIKVYLVVILIVLISSFGFAFSNHVEYGNGEFTSSACKGYYASSCYPQYDTSLDFTVVPIFDSSNYLPIVYYNMRDDLDPTFSEKYYYLVSGNSVNIYKSSDSSLYSTYTNSFYTSNSIVSQPKLLRLDFGSDHGYTLITLENTTTGFYLMQNVMNSDKSFAVFNQIQVSNKSIYLAMQHPSSDNLVSILLNNGTINVYKITNSNITLNNTINTGITPLSSLNFKYPYYSNPMVMVDVNNDFHDDLVYAIPYNTNDASYYYGNVRLGIYDLYKNTNILAPTTVQITQRLSSTGSADTIYESHLGVVKTGISGSAYKLYFYENANFVWSAVPYVNTMNYVFDLSGSTLFNPSVSANANYYASNIVFTDFNYDGLTEACMVRTYSGFSTVPKWECYNSAFVNIFSQNSSSTIRTPNFISMGKFTNNTYMSVITNTSIWNFNYSDSWQVYNLSYNKFVYSAPVGLVNKLNYSNDLFAVYNTFIDQYLLTNTAGICGDSVCSVFENELLCPEDCYNQPIINDTLRAPTLPCQNDSQCLSGKCFNYRCSYLDVNQDCTIDEQCLSQACTYGKCEQSSLSQNLQQAKNEWFGFDDMTALIIALAIIFIVTLAVIVFVAIMSQNGVASIVSGLLTFISGLIFFTAFGWIPAWILFVLFVLVIAVAVLYIFMRSNGGGG